MGLGFKVIKEIKQTASFIGLYCFILFLKFTGKICFELKNYNIFFKTSSRHLTKK
jgi:hypothetical protein